MKIFHVTKTFSKLGAGTTSFLIDYCLNAEKFDIKSGIVAIEDSKEVSDYPDPNSLNYRIAKSAPLVGDILGLPKSTSAEFSEYKDSDILHIHGVWAMIGIFGRLFAEKHQMPYLISPHGMLMPWCLKQSSIRKKIAYEVYEKRNINNAVCIHVTSSSEEDALRQTGYQGPSALIPIGMNLSSINSNTQDDEFFAKFPELKGKKILLFLSKIQPRKGLDMLINIWAKLFKEHDEWHLVIAGFGDENYIQKLQNQIRSAKLDSHVTFTGPLHDSIKDSAYSAADLFILPSYNENFGIVVAEALASGCPVITTHDTPWEDLNIHNCGWWVKTDQKELNKSLKEALSLSDAERSEMGLNGQLLISKKHSWTNIMPMYRELYEWIKNGTKKPGFVTSK